MERYASSGDPLTLAGDYLSSSDEARRRRGIQILAFLPSLTEATADAIIKLAVEDPVADIRRYAVQALCGHGGEVRIQERLQRETSPPGRRKLLRALGHARNVRGVGRRALSGLRGSVRRSVIVAGVMDLVSLYRAPFALAFAGTAGFFTLATYLLTLVIGPVLSIFPPVGVRLSFAYGDTAVILTVTLVLFALLRARIDERPVSRGYLVRTGLLAGIVVQTTSVFTRILSLALSAAVSYFANTPPVSPVNLAFPFIDSLPYALAMGVVALGSRAAATLPPARTFTWRFVASAAAASALMIVASEMVNLVRDNFQVGDLQGITNASASWVMTSVVTAGALVGFRLALRISFDDRPWPDWPVPEPSASPVHAAMRVPSVGGRRRSLMRQWAPYRPRPSRKQPFQEHPRDEGRESTIASVRAGREPRNFGTQLSSQNSRWSSI